MGKNDYASLKERVISVYTVWVEQQNTRQIAALYSEGTVTSNHVVHVASVKTKKHGKGKKADKGIVKVQSGTKNGKYRRGTCHGCGSPDHWKNECPKLHPKVDIRELTLDATSKKG